MSKPATKHYKISIPASLVPTSPGLPETIVGVRRGRIIEIDPYWHWAMGHFAFVVFLYVRNRGGRVVKLGDGA